jgi:hypothetical protein
VGEISDSRIRPLGSMLACPCHVAVTAGEAKGRWVGRSCRPADSGDGKRGRNLTLYSGHVTHNTSTHQHLLKILGTAWEEKIKRKIRSKYTIFEFMDFALHMEVRIRLTPVYQLIGLCDPRGHDLLILT